MLLVLLLALAPAPVAQAAPVLKVGVFDLALSGLDPSLKQTALDTVAAAAAEHAGFSVVTRRDLDALLGAEKIKDTLGCTEATCLAEIGAAAGVDRIIAGSVSALGAGLVISLQFINAKYASVENRVTQQWDGPLSGFVDVVGAAVDQLVLTAAEQQPASLRFAGVPADAALFVDGRAVGVGPAEVNGLRLGVRSVRVEAPGYDPFVAPVALRSGQRKQLDVQLALTAAPPLYAKWWFWTAVAAVLAGGATTAVLLSRGAESSGPSTASGTFSVPPAPTGLSFGGRP